MYSEIEVFDMIEKFEGNKFIKKEEAFNMHRILLSSIDSKIKSDCYFRYFDKGGYMGLNINNYKIYEYPFKGENIFRVIYPKDRLESSAFEDKVDFEFKSIPCVLLSLDLEELKEFILNIEEFNKAIELALSGMKNDKNIRNISIDWNNF